jgi:hypothetical protein
MSKTPVQRNDLHKAAIAAAIKQQSSSNQQQREGPPAAPRGFGFAQGGPDPHAA